MEHRDHPQTDLTDDELAAQEGAFDEPQPAGDDDVDVTVTPSRGPLTYCSNEDLVSELQRRLASGVQHTASSYRSAVDGRYVTEQTAEANPHTTVREES